MGDSGENGSFHGIANWVREKIYRRKKMENKTTKKRKPFILVAMAALLAVIFAMAGTTFAKYISTASVATTSATVAKWGYVVSTNADDLWGTKYTYQTDASKVVTGTTAGVTIVSSSTDNVVAPGSTGSITLSIKGSAEVLSAITVTAEGTPIQLTQQANADSALTTAYEPIVWSIALNGDSTGKIGDTDAITAQDNLTMAQLVTALEGISKTNIAANTTVDINVTISWAWPFSTTGHDQDDTDLAALIANSDAKGNAAGTTKMSFELGVEVVQLEKEKTETVVSSSTSSSDSSDDSSAD
jgi:hypothetical protein